MPSVKNSDKNACYVTMRQACMSRMIASGNVSAILVVKVLDKDN